MSSVRMIRDSDSDLLVLQEDGSLQHFTQSVDRCQADATESHPQGQAVNFNEQVLNQPWFEPWKSFCTTIIKPV